MKKLCITLIFFITSSFYLPIQAAQSNSVKAILGATLLDINGKNNIDNAVLIVSGEKISAIGSKDEISIPNNAEIIDALRRVELCCASSLAHAKVTLISSLTPV